MRKKLIVTPQNIFGQNPLAFPFNLKILIKGQHLKLAARPWSVNNRPADVIRK